MSPTVVSLLCSIILGASLAVTAAAADEAKVDANTRHQATFEAADGAKCRNFYASGFAPVLGQAAAPTPQISRQSKGTSLRDPNFGTCVLRATDHANEPPSGFARNDYSRRQAFNADNSYFIVNALNGFWHLYDANTLSFIRTLSGPAGDAEPQWHPTDRTQLYYLPTNGGTELRRLNVETNQHVRVANFAGRLPWTSSNGGAVAHIWTKSEGSPSADGRYWCFQAETANFGIRGVFTYDLQTDSILGTRTLSVRPDHTSMSASGRWCVLSGDDASGTVAWNTTFTQSRKLHNKSEHSDIALGTDGNDKFVFVDYQSNAGDLVMVDLDTGVRTTLFPTYISGTATAYHVSGKSFAKPGWILLSTYAHSGAELWLHERIMAVRLAANPTIVNVAHHHSFNNGYFTEPHASVSRDFSRVLFSSNWGTTSDEDVDAYMVPLPANFLNDVSTP